MTRSEFDAPMGQLVRIFSPARWTEERATEFYVTFRNWTAAEWNRVVDRAVKGLERFPVPKDLEKLRDSPFAKATAYHEELPSCPHCTGGRIWFDVKHRNGMTYTHYLACDCSSGDVVAQKKRKIAKRELTDNQVRYSWMFGKFGGITSAAHGYGVSADGAKREHEVPRSIRESSDRDKPDDRVPF